MRFIIGILLFLASLVVFQGINLNWSFPEAIFVFADLPTILVFIVAIAAILIVTNNFGVFGKSLKLVFGIAIPFHIDLLTSC